MAETFYGLKLDEFLRELKQLDFRFSLQDTFTVVAKLKPGYDYAWLAKGALTVLAARGKVIPHSIPSGNGYRDVYRITIPKDNIRTQQLDALASRLKQE